MRQRLEVAAPSRWACDPGIPRRGTMETRGIGIAACVLICWFAGVAAVDASASPPPTREWEVEIAPYVWLVMAHAQVDTPRGTQEFTLSAGEVLKHLRLGAMGSVKARWRRFVFLTDVAWAKLSDDNGLGDTRVRYDVTPKLGWFEALAGYRVYERPGGLFGTPSPVERRTFGVDLLGGLTYSWIDVRLKLSREPFLGFVPPEQRTLRPSTNWVAPYVAVRLLNDFTPRLRLETLLGLGAFGVGDAPNLGWQVTSQLQYALSEHWFLTAGGRALGIRDNNLDVTFYGPMLGGGFRFGGGR